MCISKYIKDSIETHQSLLSDTKNIQNIQKAVDSIIACYKNNGKVLLCGNGGSAADAQHIAAELTGRFSMDRPPLYAEALHTNTSYVTAVANDYSFDNIYARIIQSNSIAGDILIAISTSGKSENIIRACKTAKEKGLTVIGLTGCKGGLLKDMCDILITVPSENTARIQECHILIGHIICEIVEKELFTYDS